MRLRLPRTVAVSLFAIAVAGSFTMPAAARAAETDDKALAEAKESFTQAEKSYALGKFDDALKQYEHAFDLKPMPAFLFNIGQCYRNLGNWERASFFYQGYLNREPRAKSRDKVLALIEQMNQKVREQEEARRAAAAAIVATPPAPPSAAGNVVTGAPPASSGGEGKPAVPGAVPPVPTPPSDTPPPSTPTYKKWWVWTLVGVAVVGGGVATAMVLTNPSVSTANLNGSLGSPIDASR